MGLGLYLGGGGGRQRVLGVESDEEAEEELGDAVGQRLVGS